MKKIFLILFLLYSLQNFAQLITVNVTNGSAATLSSIDSLGVTTINNVTDFFTLYKNVKTVIVSDTLRGGIFNLYTGTDTADNGMIFTDATSRIWKRKTNGDQLYIKWYKIVPSNQTAIDHAPVIRRAISYILTHNGTFSTLQFDVCAFNTWYFVASKIYLGGIRFYGAGGQGRNPSTLFQIAAGVQPFDVRTLYADVKDIAVRHYPSFAGDSSTHSFKIRSVVHFENVSIISNPNGNGFDISGCGPNPTTSPDSIFGNPDHSIFFNCQVQFCIKGANIFGCDANAMLFQNCNFAQNATWGSYDNSFLGNTYLNCHFATNSQNNNSGVRVIDTTFYPYPDSVYNIKGKYPPTNPTYWYKSNFTGSNAVWDSTKKYFGGGSLWAANPNSNHSVIGCYTEAYQANAIISPRSVWNEGTSGSTVTGGIWEHTFGGTKFFSGTGIQANAINTNELDFNFLQGGANATATVLRNINANGSTTHTLPQTSGMFKNDAVLYKAGNPTAADIPNGKWEIYQNTLTGVIKLWTNNNGGMLGVVLQ